MSKVKIKDRDKEVEMFRMALNMVGINVDYIITDLIDDVVRKMIDKKGKFSMKDATNILVNHEEKWEEYFKKQKNDKQEEKV